MRSITPPARRPLLLATLALINIGTSFAADPDSLQLENERLRSRLERLTARREAFRWGRFTEGPLPAGGTALQIEPLGDSLLAFATDSRGLVLYDGVSFRVYDSSNSGLPDNFVTSVVAREGRLWAGTAGGLAALADGAFSRPADLPASLADGAVSCLLAAADGSLWAGTQEDGLWRLYGQQWTNIVHRDTTGSAPGINSLAADPAGGGVWAATSGDGVWRAAGDSLVRFPAPLGEGSEEVYAVTADSDGLVWIGTVGAGAGFLAGTAWRPAPLPVTDGTGVVSISELAGGDLLFGATDGTWIYHRGRNHWEKLALPEEVADAPVVAGIEHRNRLWLAPAGGGVHFYDRGLVERFTAGTGGLPSNSVYHIAQGPDGRTWFATFGGVGVYDGRRWSVLDRRGGLPENLATFVLFAPGDSTYFATHRGLGLLGPGGWSYLDRDSGLLSNTVNHLALGPDGALWICTEGGGLVRSYGGGLRTWTTVEGLPSNQVQAALPVTADSVWIATKAGLALVLPDMAIPVSRPDDPGVLLPPAAHFTALDTSVDGDLWAGSAGEGLWRLRDGAWRRYGAGDGPGANEVYAIDRAADGRMLFGTALGLSVYDGARWRNLTSRDGLEPGPVRAMSAAGDGALWLAGEANGVQRLDPSRLDPPETFIRTENGRLVFVDPDGAPREMTLLDSAVAGAAYFANEFRSPASDPATIDTARIDRATIEALGHIPWWRTPQAEFSFEWRIDGGEWRRAAGRNVTAFDLDRGDHLIDIRAAGPWLRADPTPAQYRFVVVTPTALDDWRTWAAGSLVLLIAVAGWQRERLRWWVRALRHRRFRPVTPNPFDPHRPQDEGERFIGRAELLERLDGLLSGEDPGATIIHGEERIGLTSFLLQCSGHAESAGAAVAHVDLAATWFSDVGELAGRLAGELGGPDVERADSRGGMEMLSDVLRGRDRPAAVLLDNAELLGRLLARDRAAGERFEALVREVVLAGEPVGFVFGTGTLESFREDASALFELSRLYRLGRLRHEEAVSLLTRPLRGRAAFHDRALGELTRLAEGQPYLLQWLGRELVDAINTAQSPLVTPELAARAVDRLLADPPPLLLDRWEELPRRGKLVLAAAASVAAGSGDRTAPAADIGGLLAEHGVSMVDEELAKTAADLQNRGLVRIDDNAGVLRVPDNLLVRWVERSTGIPAIAAREEYDVGRALHRFGDQLSRTFRLEDLAESTLAFFQTVLHCEWSVFFAVDGQEDQREDAGPVGLRALGTAGGDQPPDGLPDTMPSGALEKLSLREEAAVAGAEEENPVAARFPAGALLAPLMARGRPVGLLALGARGDGERYNRRDRLFVETCAEQAAVAMENARLYEEETEKERMQQELDTARRMQMAILPDRKPEFPGFDFFAHLEPATEVGGDYFDYHLLDDGRLLFVVGDVSGHGISAGTLVSMSKSCIFNQLRTSFEVEPVMSAMNEMVCGALAEKLLMTLCYCIFDPAAGRLSYSIAGHPFPYLLPADGGGLRELDISAYPLGVARKASFTTAEAGFAAGDTFVFYSDGIVEAANADGEQFGFERFERAVESGRGRDAETLIAGILRAFDEFRGGVPHDDDVTLVTVRIK